jgi:hypothetical protein
MGQLAGPKPPLRPGHVRSIRAKLQLERRTRDLAMFNLAIDSKLSGCDLVALRVDEVTWRPTGTLSTDQLSADENGSAVRFELSEVTRQTGTPAGCVR